jgi:hypothetical protein
LSVEIKSKNFKQKNKRRTFGISSSSVKQVYLKIETNGRTFLCGGDCERTSQNHFFDDLIVNENENPADTFSVESKVPK